jgi:hypothetical protein
MREVYPSYLQIPQLQGSSCKERLPVSSLDLQEVMSRLETIHKPFAW